MASNSRRGRNLPPGAKLIPSEPGFPYSKQPAGRNDALCGLRLGEQGARCFAADKVTGIGYDLVGIAGSDQIAVPEPVLEPKTIVQVVGGKRVVEIRLPP